MRRKSSLLLNSFFDDQRKKRGGGRYSGRIPGVRGRRVYRDASPMKWWDVQRLRRRKQGVENIKRILATGGIFTTPVRDRGVMPNPWERQSRPYSGWQAQARNKLLLSPSYLAALADIPDNIADKTALKRRRMSDRSMMLSGVAEDYRRRSAIDDDMFEEGLSQRILQNRQRGAAEDRPKGDVELIPGLFDDESD